jgi:hypothetical protein
MVRKRAENGTFYHEPPYTAEEEHEFYRRTAGGPVTVVRPKAEPQPPSSPHSRAGKAGSRRGQGPTA